MKKCLFLIPTSYNDGRPVASEIMVAVLEELFVTVGSFSQSGITEGLWQMKDGARIRDHSLTLLDCGGRGESYVAEETGKEVCPIVRAGSDLL